MNTSTTNTPTPAFPADPHHRHDRSCYWDHRRCGWVCPPAPPAPPAADTVPATEPIAEKPVPALGPRAQF